MSINQESRIHKAMFIVYSDRTNVTETELTHNYISTPVYDIPSSIKVRLRLGCSLNIKEAFSIKEIKPN